MPRTAFEKAPFRERELVQRREAGANSTGASARPEDEVLACSVNSSFRRKSTLWKTKTKSRLLDTKEDGERRSGWLRRSGLLPNPNRNDDNFIEEDDLFLDDDFPDEYKKMKFSCFSVIQLLSLTLIVAAFVYSLAIPFLRNKTLWGMQLWKWELMVLVLDFLHRMLTDKDQFIVLASDEKVPPESVAQALQLAANNMPFEAVYYPRPGSRDFVVDADRVKIAVETEDSSRMTWLEGTITAVSLPDNPTLQICNSLHGVCCRTTVDCEYRQIIKLLDCMSFKFITYYL